MTRLVRGPGEQVSPLRYFGILRGYRGGQMSPDKKILFMGTEETEEEQEVMGQL